MPSTERNTLQVVRDLLAEPAAAAGAEALTRAVRTETPLSELARSLANRAGGLDALLGLGLDPIPDEPFDWTAVDPADRPVVEQVLALAECACDRWLDTEYRTITRRLLARVARHDPLPLRRSKRPSRLAAGLVLAVLDGNHRIGRRAGLCASDVAAWFDTTSVLEVARRLVQSADLTPPFEVDRPWRWPRETVLASAELLHSRTRQRLIIDRDRLVGAIEEEERRRAGRRSMVRVDDERLEVRACLADVALVHKGLSQKGQIMVLVGLSPVQPQPELELFALTVPEAHELHRLLAVALGAPPPRPSLLQGHRGGPQA